MATDNEERDSDSNLTPWALAADALMDHGCDCGVDEPGTCLPCLCEAAMRAERAEKNALQEANIQMREALIPFSAIALYADDMDEEAEVPVSVGDLRRARAVLGGKE